MNSSNRCLSHFIYLRENTIDVPSVTSNTQYGTCSQHTVHLKSDSLDPAHVQAKKTAQASDSQGVHL